MSVSEHQQKAIQKKNQKYQRLRDNT